MQRILFLSLLLLVSGMALVYAQTASADQEAVKKCFEDYRKAILNDDAAAAYSLISAETREYYEEMLKKALGLSESETRQLPAIDKLMVLLTRHRIPHGDLVQMSGESHFKHAVEKGWVGKNSVSNVEITEVTVAGDVATTKMQTGASALPIGFEFRRENGAWKINLVPMTVFSGQAMRSQIAKSGINEDDYLLQLVETVSGRKPDSSIWEPVVR